MIKLVQFYSLFKLSTAENCYGVNIEFPNGFAGNSGGEGLLLSGLSSDGEYLYTGGQHDDETIQAGSPYLIPGAIPFLQKQKLTGQNIWVKFYNSVHASYLINIQTLDSENKLFAHFDQGVIAILNAEDGSIQIVKKLADQFDAWGF